MQTNSKSLLGLFLRDVNPRSSKSLAGDVPRSRGRFMRDGGAGNLKVFSTGGGVGGSGGGGGNPLGGRREKRAGAGRFHINYGIPVTKRACPRKRLVMDEPMCKSVSTRLHSN